MATNEDLHDEMMATHRTGSDNNDDDFCVSLKKIFKHCLQLALKSATPKVAVVVVAVAPCEMERIDIPPIDASMLMALPTSLRIKILNYFDEKNQEELRTLSVISKQFYEDCQHPSIEWEFIPLIEISPKEGKTMNLLYNLIKHQTDYNNTNINTQTTPYRSMKVNCMHQYDDSYSFCEPLVQMCIMDRITSLNISWLPSSHLPYYFSRMLPNLSEIFVSNTVQLGLGGTKTYFNCAKFISDFTDNCHRLEKITLDNNMNMKKENYDGNPLINPANYNRLERIRRNDNKSHYGKLIVVNGINMKGATNLRVLIMDNCTFFVGSNPYDLSDLDNYPDDFLFNRCCKSLERVSIQKARVLGLGIDEEGNTIEQEALVKFVRSVPTLRWFRSDLHQDNIDLLTKERPDIEFC